MTDTPLHPDDILRTAETLRRQIGGNFHEQLIEDIYADAARLADRAVTLPDAPPRFDLDRAIDRVVTSRVWGFPLMIALFALVFWITIAGANVPSRWLSFVFIDTIYPWLGAAADTIGLPWWLSGVLIDGMYLTTAWVVSVMLPPMAIFFPLFTLLEEFGYLPRVAFNLATLFIGGLVPAYMAGLVSALAVVGVAVLGVLLTFAASWFLSRTMLRGEVSTFSLELPPYRPPRIWQTITTSFIDRTIYVLWRAVVFAMPAGAAIWLIANVQLGGESIAAHLVGLLDPFGVLLGLNGVILLAYVVAIPANEIVMPAVLMLTVLLTGVSGVGAGAGVLVELDTSATTMGVLQAGGWTLLTAVNLMLFSLLHNPCSTTLYTIYKESGSRKWTIVAALLPLALGVVVTFVVAQVWRLLM